ncbi:MAG TPA: hypothetical protein VK752_14710 [Bryobacteraceae bacterium]|jgi:hypothetical protein|nr:hypothetical protein [Bryobacteraceae bacterium]
MTRGMKGLSREQEFAIESLPGRPVSNEKDDEPIAAINEALEVSTMPH